MKNKRGVIKKEHDYFQIQFNQMSFHISQITNKMKVCVSSQTSCQKVLKYVLLKCGGSLWRAAKTNGVDVIRSWN